MRLLVPALVVLFLAALIGCGGGGLGPSFGDAADTSTSTTSGDATNTTGTPSTTGTTGAIDLRPAAGSYTVALAGSAGAATYTGTGTATAASGGELTVSVLSTNSTDAVARAASVTVSQNGLATGTVTVGADAAAAITAGSVTLQSTGVYLLTATFTNASAVVETDRFTITQGPTAYTGPNAGTDDQGGVYAGTGTANLTTGNVLSLTYESIRVKGASVKHNHRLSSTLLSNGTFSGALDVSNQSSPTVPMTGTWSLTGNVLKLTLKYVNVNFVEGNPLTSPNATETLTLTRQ